MKRIALWLLLLASATGCHRPDDYLLAPQSDEVLNVTLSTTTLPADGIARATITAQLDPRTDIDKRQITFTTTAGTLIANGNESRSVTVPADTSGKAVVELRSTTTPATARVDVTVASVSRSTSVEFTQLLREQVFDVALSSTSVPADGFSTVVITVTLKRLGTLDQRAVKFETSAGTFNASGQLSARAVTMTAGATGRIVVELLSDAVGTAHVRVTALDTVYEFDVTFTALTQPEVFDVTVGSTSIPADGFSTTPITVTLKRPGTTQQRAVKFETSAGTLIAPGLAASKAVTLTADATGRAVVDLQSDKTVGSARVRVTNLDLPFEFTVNFTSVNPATIITVSTSPSLAPADGATPIVVMATIAPNLPAGRRTVAFRTTLGTVTPPIVEADGSNVARATLVSTTTGTARITATVDSSSADATADFTTALPDTIVVSPTNPDVSATKPNTIRVTLLRTTGSVSPRQQVSYSATTSAGVLIGSFSAITLSDITGVSQATLNVPAGGAAGTITITASVQGISGSATITYVP